MTTMAPAPAPDAQLRAENAELRVRLEEAEDTLRAIRRGEVDALVVETADGPQVFTLHGLDAESNRIRGEILAQVSDAVIAVDSEEHVTYLNAAAEHRYGVRASDALGRQLSEIYTRQWPSAETEAGMLAALREHGEWRGEIIHRTRDGREIAVEKSITALRDASGALDGRVGVFRDITTSKRIAAELQRVSGLLDTLLHTAPIGFCFLDRELRFVRVNERLAEINGISAEAHLGRQVHEILPTLIDTLLAVTGRILATGEAVLNHEFSGETSSAPGVTRYWNQSWYPVRDGAGEISGFGAVVEEITARKQADEQLRAAHDTFQHLVEHSPFGIYVVDADFRLMQVSVGAQKVFENVRPLLGRDFAEVFRIVWSEPFASETIGFFRRVLETGEPYHAPSTMEARADIVAAESYDWKVERITLPDGRPGVVCHFYDLSERQRYENVLREQEERLRSLVENSPLSVVEWNRDLVITRWAGEAEATYGWSAEEVVGRHITEVAMIYEADRIIVERVLAELTDGKTRHLTRNVRLCTKDRRQIRCIWHLSVLADAAGQTLSVLALGEDVTAQHEAAAELRLRTKELRESDLRIRLATEASEVGIWEWNIRTNAIRWDAQMFRQFGLPPTPNGLVQYSDWSGAVLPEDLPENERILKDTIRRCGQSRREFRIRRRNDGACRDIEATETVRANEAGEAEWVLGTNLDVTNRKTAEDQLRQLAAELSAANRRKDEFLATLAHELRNPLAPIRNGLELLKMGGGSGATAEKARRMMERQTAHLVRLVDDLLEVSRITRDTLELRKERVPLAAVLESALESSRPLIEQMGHDLTVSLPTPPLMVDADVTRLAQVFLNLLNNAAKYSERGGHIQLHVEREASDVVVTVKDSGIGIAADQLSRIFEMFTQVDRSLEKAQGGLGIGLTLVKRLVEMHGGTVEAKSEGPGKGSEFVVRLPVVIAAAEPQKSDGAAEHSVSCSRRILVVDDNRDSADSLSAMLKLMGHDTRTAFDGQQGVDVAAEFRPEVVLLDIGLPKLNGYDACRAIREQPWGTNVLLIAVTGWGQDDDHRRSREAGFDHHMVKPVDLQVLTPMLAGSRVATE